MSKLLIAYRNLLDTEGFKNMLRGCHPSKDGIQFAIQLTNNGDFKIYNYEDVSSFDIDYGMWIKITCSPLGVSDIRLRRKDIRLNNSDVDTICKELLTITEKTKR